MSETESAQKHGFVTIVNVKDFDITTTFDRHHEKCVTSIPLCMPTPLCAVHLCAGPERTVLSQLAVPIVKHLLNKTSRHRLLLHSGSDQELLRELSSYGLKLANFPNHDQFVTWLAERLALEGQQALDRRNREVQEIL